MSLADRPRIRILTNHSGQQASPSWRAATTCFRPSGTGYLDSLKLAYRLLREQAGFDCVVLGAGRSDILFALLRALRPSRRVPCIMIDCLWSVHPNRAKHLLKKGVFRAVNRSVDRYVVWAFHEIDDFSRSFGLPRNKFVFVPYHTTVDADRVQATRGGYLFSGGMSNRDYDTLIDAVRGLPVKLFIACEPWARGQLPGNVEVRRLSHEEYQEKLAGCRINIVALSGEQLRSAGQQTFLNSMAMGKPTIVTDLIGPLGYISNGEDGLLVKPGSARALRDAITMLLKDPALERQIGIKAAESARRFTTEEHFKKILKIAEDLAAGTAGGENHPRVREAAER